MGLIYGEYAGRSDEFQPGGVSYECGFVPHGVAYEEVRIQLLPIKWTTKLIYQQFKAASAQPPPEMQISKGAVAFMMESSRMFTIADWAWNSKKKHEHDPKMWYVLACKFFEGRVETNTC
jgi:homogentisate 1,2-dioxygenase